MLLAFVVHEMPEHGWLSCWAYPICTWSWIRWWGTNPGNRGHREYPESEWPCSFPLYQFRTSGKSLQFSNPPSNHPKFPGPKQIPAGQHPTADADNWALPGNALKLFWQHYEKFPVSNQTVPVTLWPHSSYIVFYIMFFSSDIHHSDWDPKPAVPGDSQQESLFLPSVSTQKFWKARPEWFQRPWNKNTFMRSSP